MTERTFSTNSVEELNGRIRPAKSISTVGLVYRRVESEIAHLTCYVDASFASKEHRYSQI